MVLVGYLVYCTIILVWQTNEKELQKADAIIVLTGARGRIESGIELLFAGYAPRLLISGVTEEGSLPAIVTALDMNETEKQAVLDHCCIELDHMPTDTATNATETARWIEDNNIHSIILVTSAAHMPRAYLQFYYALPDDVQTIAYPYHGEKRRSDLVLTKEFWSYAWREYKKFIGSWVRLQRQ